MSDDFHSCDKAPVTFCWSLKHGYILGDAVKGLDSLDVDCGAFLNSFMKAPIMKIPWSNCLVSMGGMILEQPTNAGNGKGEISGDVKEEHGMEGLNGDVSTVDVGNGKSMVVFKDVKEEVLEG